MVKQNSLVEQINNYNFCRLHSTLKGKLIGSAGFRSLMACGVQAYWLIDFPVYDINNVGLILCGWMGA